MTGLRSESSKKQYAVTYRQWMDWTIESGMSPYDINAETVSEYLSSITSKSGGPASIQTRSNKLAHMRKLVKYISIYVPEVSQVVDALQFMKVPTEDAEKHVRRKKALTPQEVHKVMDVWRLQEKTPYTVRNQAIVSLSLATGVRVAEMAALTWDDVDFEDGTAHILHGKGDKERTVAIMNGVNALDYLYDWQTIIPEAAPLFRPIYHGKVSKNPVSIATIQGVISKTSSLCGIKFSHHSFRRTLLTELSRGGMGVLELMDQAGHASPRTLTHYVASSDAIKRRESGKTRWSG